MSAVLTPSQRASRNGGAAAMILAAGRGERMRPLTDSCPKPLLQVHGRALIDWHVKALALGGFTKLVINTAWLDDSVVAHFSSVLALQPIDYAGIPLSISYSHEARDFGAALETGGGIARALPLLGNIFWVLAGDVYAPGFEFLQHAVQRFAASGKLAHLWLVPNPAHNPHGDFGLSNDGLALNLVSDSQAQRLTYSSIGLFHRAFFDRLAFGNPAGVKAPLAPMLRRAMDNQQVSAELYAGPWTDVGTPQRLTELNATPFTEAKTRL